MYTISRQGRFSGAGVLSGAGHRNKPLMCQALKWSLSIRQVLKYPFQSSPFSGATHNPPKNRTSTKPSIAIFTFILNSIKNLLAKAAATIINKEFSHIFVRYFLRPWVNIVFISRNILSYVSHPVKQFLAPIWKKFGLSPLVSWIVVFTLLWQNIIWAQPFNSSIAPRSRFSSNMPKPGEEVLLLAVQCIVSNPQFNRLRELQGQLKEAVGDEKERLQGQWDRVIHIIEGELARYVTQLKISLKDISFSEAWITIRINVDGRDLSIEVDSEGRIRSEGKPARGIPSLGVSAELSLIKPWERVPHYKGLDYIVISDNPGGVTRQDGLDAIREFKDRFPDERFNFILTITTKTRRLEEIKERIQAGYKLGVRNFLIVTGDVPGEGPDSIQAIQYLKRQEGLPLDIRLGATENPFAGPGPEERVSRLSKKIMAGADFIITQPVFNLDEFRDWMRLVRARGLHRLVPIWASIMPITDIRLLKKLNERLGLAILSGFYSHINSRRFFGSPRRYRNYGEFLRSEMQSKYNRILETLCSEEGLAGIHIIPLKGSERLAGYSRIIRGHPGQGVVGGGSKEGDSVLYKRDEISPELPTILLRAPLNSMAAINDLTGLLEGLEKKGQLDKFNIWVHLYKEEAPAPTPHHPDLTSGTKGGGASYSADFVFDFDVHDYGEEDISDGFRDYLGELQLEIDYKRPWWHKALLFIFRFCSTDSLIKVPLFGCIRCGQCVLSTTALICIMHCPKQMRNGPCGDLSPDGKCRLGGDCPWYKIHKRLKRWKRYSRWAEARGLYWLANFLDREPLLRQILSPWNPRLGGTSSQLNTLDGIVKGIEFTGRPRDTLRIRMPESQDLARELRRRFDSQNNRLEIYLSILKAIASYHQKRTFSKERIIADIRTWEERIKERKKDLAFRKAAHKAISRLINRFYGVVEDRDFVPLRDTCRRLEAGDVPSGEELWKNIGEIAPVEVLDGVTGVIGEMTIGEHLRETVENINRLVRFNPQDQSHFQYLDKGYLDQLKRSIDELWQNPKDRVILYLASILHDYGMFLRNYGTNSHAVDGERMLRPLIDRLIQNNIITKEQSEIILALVGGHVLIRIVLGYIPPEDVYHGLRDPGAQERFLRCLLIMYFGDCAATPLFQSVELMNEMARRTIEYTDTIKIQDLDRLRLLSGVDGIEIDEPWLAEFLNKATFDMPTEIMLFRQLEPEILIKFLYYLDRLRNHFNTNPDFLFIVDGDSSERITEILKPLDFSMIDASLIPAYPDKDRIVVQIKDELDRMGRRHFMRLGLALSLPLFCESPTQLPLDNLGAMAEWIRYNTNSLTGLPASHPDDPQFINWGFLYDHSIAAIILSLANDKEGAYEILDFYQRRYSTPVEELIAIKDQNNVVGILRVLPDLKGDPLKGIINAVDISDNSQYGYGKEWYVDTGPQAWLGIALLKVEPARYMGFAKEIGEFILRLQDTDGAIVAGPMGQMTSEFEVDRSQLKHTEHNLSSYTFLRMLYEMTKDTRFKDAASRVKDWLLNTAYRKDGGYFIQGIHHGIPNWKIASDVQAWAILSLGVEVLGLARAERILKFLEERALVQVGDISGLDFTDPRDPTVINERGGYKPMISPEWTAGLIMAYYEMGGTYKTRADRLYNDMWRLANKDGDRISFPYATLKGVPTGHGWDTPNSTESLSGMWMGFIERRFNPFGLKKTKPGSPETANEVIKGYLLDRDEFTLEEYLLMLDLAFSHLPTLASSGYKIAKVTARRDLEKLSKRGWIEIDKSKRPYRYRVRDSQLKEEEDKIRRLEEHLDELPKGEVITFIFDLDGTLITDEGKRPDGVPLSETINYARATSYGIPRIFNILKQRGHRIGILTDAGISYTLISLRQLGVELESIDYLMTSHEPLGMGLVRNIAEAWGWTGVESVADLCRKLEELGIKIMIHQRDEKINSFKNLVTSEKPRQVVVCDDREEELEKIRENQGAVRILIGINCKETFSSLAGNLDNALNRMADARRRPSIIRVAGYMPSQVSPALYRELIPKIKIEIKEDTLDPMAEYLLGAGRKTIEFWERLWYWLWEELDVKQLKIIDASVLVRKSTPDTATGFLKFISGWIWFMATSRKWINLYITIVNTEPDITREDILKTLGIKEESLGKHLQILDFSTEDSFRDWLDRQDGRITTVYLDTPGHREFFCDIPEINPIPVAVPGEGEFISGSAVLAGLLMDRPEFFEETPSPMREELEEIFLTPQGEMRIPVFKHNPAHLPIERDGSGYTEKGEDLICPTPVWEVDMAFFEELCQKAQGLPPPERLYKVFRKILVFYKLHGEEKPFIYWVQIRKGLKKPLSIEGRTITIDIDLLMIDPDLLLPFLIFVAGHEGSHSLFEHRYLLEKEEEAIVLFMDALRFSKISKKAQDRIIGAFRSLKGLKDTRYIEFLEGIRDNPKEDLAGLIEDTLQIDTRGLELVIYENGAVPTEINGVDELFSSFRYPKIKWSLVITRREYRGQLRIKKKVVLFDENGHLITDERLNGITVNYGVGLNSLYWSSMFFGQEHQRQGLGTELCGKIEELALLNAFDSEYPKVTIELTPSAEGIGFWRERGDKPPPRKVMDSSFNMFEKSIDINRPYLRLAQRILPLIIPHINPDIISQGLPKGGAWSGKRYTREGLLYLISQDPTGSVASVMLDAILSNIELEPILTLPEIEFVPEEKRLIHVRLKQLNPQAQNQGLNDILDSIYLRSKSFNDYLARARAVIRLEDFKERLSKFYLLVDVARMDSDLATQLVRLRRQGRIARIIWAGPDMADEKAIRDRLDEFDFLLYRTKDIFIPNQATDYTDYVKDILRRNNIPMDRLIIIATQENYNTVYRYIGEGLRDAKLSLTVKEFDFLTPYLSKDILIRFEHIGDRYFLELDPLTDDPRECIEGFREAQENLARVDDLAGLLSHRFPKHIREALVKELEKEGYVLQDIRKAIWSGLTWTDGAVIGFKDDALFNIAAQVLSKVLKRPISADAVKAVLEYHEEIHRRFHSEGGRIKRLQDELISVMGAGKYRELLRYFQNQYGKYSDEARLIEELAVNLYMERILGNPLRLLDEYNNVVVLEKINPQIVPIIETHTKDIVDGIDIEKLRFGKVLNDLYIARFSQPEDGRRPASAIQPEAEPVRPPRPERPPPPTPPQRPVPEVRPGMQVRIIGAEVLGVGTVVSLEGNIIVIEFSSGRRQLVWSVVKYRLKVIAPALSPSERIEEFIAGEFEKEEFREVSDTEAVKRISVHFSIQEDNPEYKEVIRIFYTYRFFEFLKHIYKELDWGVPIEQAKLKLRFSYLDKYIHDLLSILISSYGNFENIFIKNRQRINEILGSELDYQRDIRQLELEGIRNWLLSPKGTKSPESISVFVGDSGSVSLLSVGDIDLNFTGLPPGNYVIVFEEDPGRYKRYLWFWQEGRIVQRYLVFKDGEVQQPVPLSGVSPRQPVDTTEGKRIWELIAGLNNQIDTAPNFAERIRLMGERNSYRAKLWELLKATRLSKLLRWKDFAKGIGIDQNQLRTAIYDYFIEITDGDIARIAQLMGLAEASLNVYLHNYVGAEKLHWVRAVAKTKKGVELSEEERLVLVGELIEKYMADSTFPVFSFKTITRFYMARVAKERGACRIHLASIGDERIIISEGLLENIGEDKEVVVSTEFDPDYGWLFVVTHGDVRLFYKKTPGKNSLDLIDPVQETILDSIRPDSNIKPRPLTTGEFTQRYGPRVILEMVRHKRFNEPNLILYPFRITAFKAVDRGMFHFGRIEDTRYATGKRLLTLQSNKLIPEKEYRIQPYFSTGLGQWVFVVTEVDKEDITLIFSGKEIGEEIHIYQLEGEELDKVLTELGKKEEYPLLRQIGMTGGELIELFRNENWQLDRIWWVHIRGKLIDKRIGIWGLIIGTGLTEAFRERFTHVYLRTGRSFKAASRVFGIYPVNLKKITDALGINPEEIDYTEPVLLEVLGKTKDELLNGLAETNWDLGLLYRESLKTIPNEQLTFLDLLKGLGIVEEFKQEVQARMTQYSKVYDLAGSFGIEWNTLKALMSILKIELKMEAPEGGDDIWVHIVELDGRIIGSTSFQERAELMAERNRYRLQLWELLKSTRTGKHLQWIQLARRLGIDEAQLRRTIWDYFVEVANGDIEQITRLSGFAMSVVDMQIKTNVGMKKVYLVRGLARAIAGEELLEAERFEIAGELIGKYLFDPTFPSISFKVKTQPRKIEDGKTASSIYLAKVEGKLIIILEGLEERFGSNREFTVRTVFKTEYGWLFEVTDDSGTKLTYRKVPDKICLELIEPVMAEAGPRTSDVQGRDGRGPASDISLGQRLYEEIRRATMDGTSPILWSDIARSYKIEKRDLVREVVIYLAQVHNGDLTQMAKALWMKLDSFKRNIISRYGLTQELQRLRGVKVPAATPKEIWKNIVALDKRIDTSIGFQERLQLMEERNRYREQLWDLLRANIIEKEFPWEKMAGELGIRIEQLRTVIYDYFVEITSGDIERIAGLMGRSTGGISSELDKYRFTGKLHWVRAVKKAKDGEGLSEQERLVMVREVLESFKDSTYPSFSFETVVQKRIVGFINLAAIGEKRILISKGLQETFGTGKKVTVKTIFDTDYGWLFLVTDGGKGLYYRKITDKDNLDLIDPIQESILDSIEPKKNIFGKPIRPRELKDGEFTRGYGERVITEMVRCNRFDDPSLELYPFQATACSVGEKARLYFGILPDPESGTGERRVHIQSTKLADGVTYTITPRFINGRWILTVSLNDQVMLTFSGRKKGREIFLYQLEDGELSPQPELSPIEKYIADGFEKGLFKDLGNRRAIADICHRFGIRGATTGRKEVARIFYTYKFFEYLKGLGKEVILERLGSKYVQRHKKTLFANLILHYGSYEDVFARNVEKISKILGFEIDYQRDIRERTPDDVRDWLLDKTGNVPVPKGYSITITSIRYTLSRSKAMYLDFTGLEPGVYQITFEESQDKKDKYVSFYKGDGLFQKYQVVKGGQILAQKMDGVEMGLAPMPLIAIDPSEQLRRWILENGHIPDGREVYVGRDNVIKLCELTDLTIRIYRVSQFVGQKLWISYSQDESGKNKFITIWRDRETSQEGPDGYLARFYIVKDGEILAQVVRGQTTGRAPESLIKTRTEELEDFLLSNGPVPKGHSIPIGGKSRVAQLINTSKIKLYFSAGLKEYAGEKWATYEVVGNDRLIILWPSEEETGKPDGKYICRVYLVKDGVCLAQEIDGQKTGRRPIVAEEEAYRQVGDKRLKESEIAKGMHNEYLLRCLTDHKTGEAAKEALKLMRNEEKLIDLLKALGPYDSTRDAVDRNLVILEILDAIGIANELVFKRLGLFSVYSDRKVQLRAIEVLRSLKRLYYVRGDEKVLGEYRKGPQYLTADEIAKIESPLTLEKLYGREISKFQREFPDLDREITGGLLAEARREGLSIGELRKRLKELGKPSPRPPGEPRGVERFRQAEAFLDYCREIAARRGLTVEQKVALVRERFPERDDKHILKHLSHASARIVRDDDDDDDSGVYMRGRSMRDVYNLTSLRYRLFYDFDLALHDYDLVLQDIETLIRFDLRGEPIPQSINQTNLMLFKLELRRKGERERLVLFTTKPSVNIPDALNKLGLDVEVISREDYENLVKGPYVAPALLEYVHADSYTHRIVLTIEENYYLWQGLLDIVRFVDNRRYPVDDRLRKELLRIGLDRLIQDDLAIGPYLDISHEVPSLGDIQEELLMEQIIEDEA